MNIEHRGISKEVYSTEFRPLVSELYKKCEKYGVPFSLLLVVEKTDAGERVICSQYTGQDGMLEPERPVSVCFCNEWSLIHDNVDRFWNEYISRIPNGLLLRYCIA